MSDTEDAVYRTPDGREVRCRITPERDLPPSAPNVPLTRQLVRVETADEESVLLRLAVGHAGSARDRGRAFTQLDDAILAGVRIARCARGVHPPEITRLVGHHDDPVTPFALVQPHTGQPIGELLGRRQLFDEERAAFRDGLLNALSWLSAAEVVHRDLRPGTVLWDPERRTVQVCDLTSATVVGVPRAVAGTPPWASPEQREGTGWCDPRDDVWSAGLLLFQVLTGHDVEAEARLPLEDFGSLAAELGGVFEYRAELRPSADDLLERFTGRAPRRRPVDTELSAGHRAFDERLRRRRAAAETDPGGRMSPDWLIAPEPDPPPARRYWVLGAVAGVALVVVLVALTFFLGG
ncbi:protein kinase [Nocardiopsis sp. NPDC049922]|uniref:protein kinase domain-containing protein n=1 Tax=Nocardiopsis sp. NPDC049922 TaxID=3155157 RepID=UPI0034015072